MANHSISKLISGLKVGDDRATKEIWARYVARLVRIAHARLKSSPKRAADEDDVVVRAFAAFFKGIEAGRFSQLSDRNDLWQVLVMLTERHAIDQQRKEQAQKRGGGKVRGDSVFRADGEGFGFEQLEDPSPTPEFVMQTTEELELLLDELNDPVLRRVALLKLEGYTNEEIADKIERAVCTVERKLATIRDVWIEHRPMSRQVSN